MALLEQGYVLVVDDDPDARSLIVVSLEQHGLEVVSAEGGAQALEQFTARPAALVLLDVMMPGLDGFETLAKLRELPQGSEAMVVFLTALGDAGTQDRAAEAGADDFLSKPFQVAELLVRVHSQMAAYRMRQELRNCYRLIKSQVTSLVAVQRSRRSSAQMLVHDLRNQLVAVLCGVSNAIPHARPEAQEDLEAAQQGALEMKRLFDDLLDIERSDAGQVPVNMVPLDLAELTAQVCNVSGPRLGAKGLSLLHRCEGSDLTCRGDRNLVSRALGNLLDNAIRHAPQGSEIRVEVLRKGDHLDVVVSDEGPGVPESLREQLFERYARFNGHGEHRGHGLGLAFCRMVAEVHGGSATVDSTSAFTRFRLSLARDLAHN